jgi:hypothetical protein
MRPYEPRAIVFWPNHHATPSAGSATRSVGSGMMRAEPNAKPSVFATSSATSGTSFIVANTPPVSAIASASFHRRSEKSTREPSRHATSRTRSKTAVATSGNTASPAKSLSLPVSQRGSSVGLSSQSFTNNTARHASGIGASSSATGNPGLSG